MLDVVFSEMDIVEVYVYEKDKLGLQQCLFVLKYVTLPLVLLLFLVVTL